MSSLGTLVALSNLNENKQLCGRKRELIQIKTPAARSHTTLAAGVRLPLAAQRSRIAASGANFIVDAAQAFPTLKEAMGDLNWVAATSARQAAAFPDSKRQ